MEFGVAFAIRPMIILVAFKAPVPRLSRRVYLVSYNKGIRIILRVLRWPVRIFGLDDIYPLCSVIVPWIINAPALWIVITMAFAYWFCATFASGLL